MKAETTLDVAGAFHYMPLILVSISLVETCIISQPRISKLDALYSTASLPARKSAEDALSHLFIYIAYYLLWLKPTKGNLFGLTVDREKIQILDLRVVYPPDFYSWTNWRCPPQESPRISRELIAPVKAGRGNSLIRFMTIIKGQNRKPSDLCLAFQIRFPSHSMAKRLPRASRASRHRASLSFCKAGNRHVNALLWTMSPSHPNQGRVVPLSESVPW